MLNLIVLILAGYGLTSILGWGKIFDKPRGDFRAIFRLKIAPRIIDIFQFVLLTRFNPELILVLENKVTEFAFCHLCIGFWAGIFLHFFTPVNNFFIDACIVSGTAYFIDTLAVRLEVNNIQDSEEDNY